MKKRRMQAGGQAKSPRGVKAKAGVPQAKLSGKRVLPLTTVRGTLSPLLRQLEKTKSTVGIAVHGKVRGYLVPSATYERLQEQATKAKRRGNQGRSLLRGSLTLIGDLEEGSRKASAAWADAVKQSADALR